MADEKRLLELCDKWATPTCWRVLAKQISRFNKCKEDVTLYYKSRRQRIDRKQDEPEQVEQLDRAITDYERLAEESEREADTWHRHHLELSSELTELHHLVCASAPELLGRVPTAEFVPLPDDAKLVEWAKEVKALLGLLLVGKDTEPPVPIRSTMAKVSVNDHMVAELHKNASSIEWSQRDWASRLDCGSTAVGKADAWQTILKARALDKARRMEGQKQRQR